MNTLNWNMEQHKAYAAEQERRARQQQQAAEAHSEDNMPRRWLRWHNDTQR
jgi:hypothetical protein